MDKNAASGADHIYGILAEFPSAEHLVDAARLSREAGYRDLDAYTPMPVEGLSEAVGNPPSRMPLIVLLGGISGGGLGYLMQWYLSVVDYPLNIGGRPEHPWPAFIPVTFELTILGAAIAAVLGMLALNGLPRPHHPLFNVPEFSLATQNRFFLCIEARDPQFDAEQTFEFMSRLQSINVVFVPN